MRCGTGFNAQCQGPGQMIHVVLPYKVIIYKSGSRAESVH